MQVQQVRAEVLVAVAIKIVNGMISNITWPVEAAVAAAVEPATLQMESAPEELPEAAVEVVVEVELIILTLLMVVREQMQHVMEQVAMGDMGTPMAVMAQEPEIAVHTAINGIRQVELAVVVVAPAQALLQSRH